MKRQELADLRFEWNEHKAAINYAKHGIAFDEAPAVFFDDHAIYEPNNAGEGEARFQVIGSVAGLLVLFVAYTERNHDGKETIRIISARKADKAERRRYFEAY